MVERGLSFDGGESSQEMVLRGGSGQDDWGLNEARRR